MAKRNRNICFILTHIPDPRINKRIKVFQKKAMVTVLCVRRKNQDYLEPVEDVYHEIYDMDLPGSEHLASRLKGSFFYIKKMLFYLKSIQPDTLYVEGMEPLLIAFLYKKIKKETFVFVESADIREIFLMTTGYWNIIKRIALNGLTQIMFKSVNHLVITSPMFYEKYYYKYIDKKCVTFIPNMPDIQHFQSYRKKDAGRFTIGFIGGIRYLDQMKMLADAAEKCDCDVLFAGAGETSQTDNAIREYCKTKTHVTFTGKYDYKMDIAKLYGMVDCIYSVYDADNPNVRIALPNKLYESIYCELPIIVAKNTYLSTIVESLKVGVSVNHDDPSELVMIINKMKVKDKYYYDIVKACRSKKAEYADSSSVDLEDMLEEKT